MPADKLEGEPEEAGRTDGQGDVDTAHEEVGAGVTVGRVDAVAEPEDVVAEPEGVDANDTCEDKELEPTSRVGVVPTPCLIEGRTTYLKRGIPEVAAARFPIAPDCAGDEAHKSV